VTEVTPGACSKDARTIGKAGRSHRAYLPRLEQRRQPPAALTSKETQAMSMAHPVNHPAILRGPAGFVQSIAATFRRFAEWQDARSAMRQLSRLPDAALKDMGITRNEIPGAVLHGRAEALRVAPHEGAFR
jgi:uncharacterized protein YjiS (DUF1127 family)